MNRERAFVFVLTPGDVSRSQVQAPFGDLDQLVDFPAAHDQRGRKQHCIPGGPHHNAIGKAVVAANQPHLPDRVEELPRLLVSHQLDRGEITNPLIERRVAVITPEGTIVHGPEGKKILAGYGLAAGNTGVRSVE